MSDIKQVLAESIDRANEAILVLEVTQDFRHEGLTLEQWLEARDSYVGQLAELQS